MEEGVARRLMAAVRSVRAGAGWTLEVTNIGIRVRYMWTSHWTENSYTVEECVTWDAIKHHEHNPILLAMVNLREQRAARGGIIQ